MRIKRIAPLLLVAIIGAIALLARDSWDVPYEQWNRSQVAKMFNDSPWAQLQTFSNELGAGNLGQNEFHYNFTVRLFSSLPIREAYVRMLEIMNNYEQMPAVQRQNFDTHVKGLVHADVKDEVVLSVAFSSDDPNGKRDVERFLNTATVASLSQAAYLYTSSAGRIDLAKYLPPENEGIGARFIYPRVVNGKAILAEGDKDMHFEFWVAPINQRLLVGFKPSKLVFNGKLEY